MRILFLTQVLPYPLDAGPKVRAYYTLRHLAERGHKITLVSLVRDSDSEAAWTHLRAMCERVVGVPIRRTRAQDALAMARSLVTGQPLLITRDHVPAMLRAVRDLVENPFDLVHADQLWMAPYALAAAAAQRPRPRLILDQHNAVYLIPERLADAASNPWLRAAYRREAALMQQYEAKVCLEFDVVVTVTGQDRQRLASLYANGRRATLGPSIPICIEPPERLPATPTDPAALLFVGGMHWPPNADGVRWFAEEVLPQIRVQAEKMEFTAVGRIPSNWTVANEESVQLPGYVEDLEPYWKRRPIFVVPLRAGGGMRVKILEAWARGLAVVSTRVGAEGLAWEDGENLLIADTPANFAAAVLRLYAEPALAARLAMGGRETVARHYDWRTAYAAWDGVYAPPN